MTDAAHSEIQISPPGEPPPLPPQKNWAVSLFIGRDGLRSGWRVVIFFLLLIGSVAGCLKLLHALGLKPHHGAFTPTVAVLGELILLFGVVLSTAVVARFEHRGLGSYGLGLRPGFLRRFAVGSIWGIAALACVLLTMRGLHVLDFGPSDISGAALVRAGILWAIAFTLTGIVEQSAMRGYPLFALTRSVGFWPAAVITSLLFALIHVGNSGEAVVGIIAVFAVGLVFCLMLRRTGDLWFAIGNHFAWDYGESFIFGVPNSGNESTGHLLTTHMHGSRWLTGGSVGPEGSLLVFVGLGVMALAFHYVYPQVRLGTSDSSPRFTWRT